MIFWNFLKNLHKSKHFLRFYIGKVVYYRQRYSTPSVLKDYARKAQLGSIFTFDFSTSSGDGVFRTSPRGWYSFSHTALGKLFFFGHLWHASRAVFQDLWTGLATQAI
jgi:hypothetical protein